MRLLRPLVTAAALCAFPYIAASQQPAQAGAGSVAASARDAVVWQIADAERKFVALAEAMPVDKYGWRPGEGVRSVGEVFAHVATANYMIPARFMGVAAAEDVPPDMERTVTDKAELVRHLRASFAYARRVAQEMADADLAAAITLFGQPSTKLGAAVVIATHSHEHLGQSIAYARTNGVVPPWSAGR